MTSSPDVLPSDTALPPQRMLTRPPGLGNPQVCSCGLWEKGEGLEFSLPGWKELSLMPMVQFR